MSQKQFKKTNLNITKLSKQQRAILECLLNSHSNGSFLPSGYWCHIRKISWFVAHRFNRGHNDKIWDAKQAKIEAAKEGRSKEQLHLIFSLIDGLHKKQQLLTPKLRASFSRSLRRLQSRDLVECYVELRIEVKDGKWFWVWYVGDGRTRYVGLTDKGIELAHALRMLTVSKEASS